MSVEEAYEFFGDNKKISKKLKAMLEVGLPYLALGQPLSTLSGGERQRVKLAKDLDKKGNIYILDEPTTGLHASDIKGIMILLDSLVKRGKLLQDICEKVWGEFKKNRPLYAFILPQNF